MNSTRIMKFKYKLFLNINIRSAGLLVKVFGTPHRDFVFEFQEADLKVIKS